MSNAQRIANMAERATLETMLERIAVVETPQMVIDNGQTDGFQLGVLASCAILKSALTEMETDGE